MTHYHDQQEQPQPLTEQELSQLLDSDAEHTIEITDICEYMERLIATIDQLKAERDEWKQSAEQASQERHDATRRAWRAEDDAAELRQKCERMEKVVEAARKLRDQMKYIENHPKYMGVWINSQNHSGPYTGPKWDTEERMLDDALSHLDAHPTEHGSGSDSAGVSMKNQRDAWMATAKSMVNRLIEAFPEVEYEGNEVAFVEAVIRHVQQPPEGEQASEDVPEGYDVWEYDGTWDATVGSRNEPGPFIRADGSESQTEPQDFPTRSSAIAACWKHKERQQSEKPTPPDTKYYSVRIHKSGKWYAELKRDVHGYLGEGDSPAEAVFNLIFGTTLLKSFLDEMKQGE